MFGEVKANTCLNAKIQLKADNAISAKRSLGLHKKATQVLIIMGEQSKKNKKIWIKRTPKVNQGKNDTEESIERVFSWSMWFPLLWPAALLPSPLLSTVPARRWASPGRHSPREYKQKPSATQCPLLLLPDLKHAHASVQNSHPVTDTCSCGTP